MTKGTPSMGMKSGKVSCVRCRRCGRRSFHVSKHKCSSCGFGKTSKLRKYSWNIRKKRAKK